MRLLLPARAFGAALLICLVAAGLAGCGRKGALELPPGSSAAVPQTVSPAPSPQVTAPSGGLATDPLGPAYQTGVPDQRVVPGTGRSSFPLDPLL